jgi:hypothetical protein
MNLCLSNISKSLTLRATKLGVTSGIVEWTSLKRRSGAEKQIWHQRPLPEGVGGTTTETVKNFVGSKRSRGCWSQSAAGAPCTPWVPLAPGPLRRRRPQEQTLPSFANHDAASPSIAWTLRSSAALMEGIVSFLRVRASTGICEKLWTGRNRTPPYLT